MGSMEFRCKRVPDAVASFMGKKGGKIKITELKAGLGIRATIDFYRFDMKCTVTSFDMNINMSFKEKLSFVARQKAVEQEKLKLEANQVADLSLAKWKKEQDLRSEFWNRCRDVLKPIFTEVQKVY